MNLAQVLANLLEPNAGTNRMIYEKVIEHLLIDGYVTTTQIHSELNIPLPTVQKWFRDLQKRGVLKKTKRKVLRGDDWKWEWGYEWGADFKWLIEKAYLRVIKGRKA